jgi:capsule polysaccharide export protein KpsE/RkpR
MREQMVAFDTYTHINELKKAGFKEEQAASIIKSLMDSRETDISHIATKDQLNKFESSTNIRFAKIEGDIASLKNEMKAMILETHASTLKWMVGTMIAFAGIILAGIKLL